MAARTRQGAPAPQFEIWQVGDRIHSIDHPVRLDVLALLEQRPRTLGHLVAAVQRAKSTLSALHLAPLVEAGLVEEAADPNDSRVKWFKLRGHRLGRSDVDKERLRDSVLGYVESTGFVPLGPLLDVLDVPALCAQTEARYRASVARRLGLLFRRMMMSGTGHAAADELDRLLVRAGLGRVEWRQGKAHARARRKAEEPFVRALVAAALGPEAA